MTDLVLSASQAETYDPEQPGGCPRRWWLERVQGEPRPHRASAEDGTAGHALLAAYLRGEALPKRARMLKAVKGALLWLPKPEAGLFWSVEARFDGQPSHAANGERVQLNHERTLWLGGVPWDGYVDLRWYQDGTATVWDHKFSSDIDANAKPADALIRTIQMPVYALDSLRLWPEAERFRLVHLYISRRGMHSFVREQTVTREQLRSRGREISALVARKIQETARATTQEDVPHNRKACDAYGGCPHQSICTAFRRKPVYELTEEEKALFGVVSEVTGEKSKTPAPKLDVIRADADETEQLQAQREADERPVSIPLPEASVPTASEQRDVAALAAERAKPDTVGKFGALAQCRDCPHPPHPVGVQCTGKRGRGQCRCFATGPTPAGGEAVHQAATLAAAKAIAQGDAPPPDTASGPTVGDLERVHAAARPHSTNGLEPVHPLSGTLRVEIDLSPGLHSLLERILARVR